MNSKNPHAVALGRRGGKKGGLAKVRKGFAAMPAAEAKRIRALALKARRAGLKSETPEELVDAVIAVRLLTGVDLSADVRRALAAETRKKSKENS